jgi:hypothetical protein
MASPLDSSYMRVPNCRCFSLGMPWGRYVRTQAPGLPLKMLSRVGKLFGFAVLLAVAPALSAGLRDGALSDNHRTAVDDSHQTGLTAILAETVKPPAQTWVVRTTGGIDTTGRILIAVLHGRDAALVQEGQLVRAFSINSRTRMHLARVTRVTRQRTGVRVEATLAARVLGVSTRYLMEIVTESI